MPKNDFTRKMTDFNIFTKLSKNVGDLKNKLLPKALKSCPKSNKSPNLVTLMLSYKVSNEVRNFETPCYKTITALYYGFSGDFYLI